MKEEIVGGIRNGLARGESLEKTMQTLVNAGYSTHEVREAASIVSPSASGLMQVSGSAAEPSSIVPTTGSSSAGASSSTTSSESSSASASSLPANGVPLPPGQSKSAAPLLQTRPTVQPQPLQKTEASHGKKFVIILLVIFILLLGALIFTIAYSEPLATSLFNK